MDLTLELTGMARAAGASLAGVAPVERFDGAPAAHHPRDLLPGAKAVLTFGIRLVNRTLEWPELLLGSPFFPEAIRLEAARTLFYKRSGYDIVNDRLNQIALTLATHLEDLGHPALFFPATAGGVSEKLAQCPGIFSQRHAAVRAGLGEFGLNNLVVTPQFGPRIRFNSVITAAPLSPSPLQSTKVCLGESCEICLDACPVQAISRRVEATADGVSLSPASRTDWTVCRKSQAESACMGRCLRVCPLGRNGQEGTARPAG